MNNHRLHRYLVFILRYVLPLQTLEVVIIVLRLIFNILVSNLSLYVLHCNTVDFSKNSLTR